MIETGLSDVLVTWNTGQVGPSIEVNQPSTYVATSQVSGCQFVDSMCGRCGPAHNCSARGHVHAVFG